jgi:hypothetical protein
VWVHCCTLSGRGCVKYRGDNVQYALLMWMGRLGAVHAEQVLMLATSNVCLSTCAFLHFNRGEEWHHLERHGHPWQCPPVRQIGHASRPSGGGTPEGGNRADAWDVLVGGLDSRVSGGGDMGLCHLLAPLHLHAIVLKSGADLLPVRTVRMKSSGTTTALGLPERWRRDLNS